MLARSGPHLLVLLTLQYMGQSWATSVSCTNFIVCWPHLGHINYFFLFYSIWKRSGLGTQPELGQNKTKDEINFANWEVTVLTNQNLTSAKRHGAKVLLMWDTDNFRPWYFVRCQLWCWVNKLSLSKCLISTSYAYCCSNTKYIYTNMNMVKICNTSKL